MTRDGKVELARRIANQLIGVTSSEWGKWLSFVKTHGLEHAIRMARTLAKSPSLRPGPRRSYETIGRAMVGVKELRNIPPADLKEILGYISQWLVSRRGIAVDEEEKGTP